MREFFKLLFFLAALFAGYKMYFNYYLGCPITKTVRSPDARMEVSIVESTGKSCEPAYGQRVSVYAPWFFLE